MSQLRKTVLAIVLIGLMSTSSLAGSPLGKWRGQWTSHSTGHAGPMRARVRAIDSNTYRVWYAGRFAKVIPFVYPAKLKRVAGTTNVYSSSQHLPLIGEYRMTATVSSGQFQARYTSKKDSGVFQMSR